MEFPGYCIGISIDYNFATLPLKLNKSVFDQMKVDTFS